ncbi:MAG TPA: hypothetical protein VHU40_05450 [Polyangia bacterium]|nr:hypothetical protein [Polyangia bacterium]
MSKDVRVHPRGADRRRLRLLGAHAARTPALSRDDAAVGGMFTTWDRPPVTKAAEASVVTAFDGATDVTEIGAPARWRRLVRRLESLRAWGFVAVATLTFGVVYGAIHRWAPVTRPGVARAEGQPNDAPRAPVPLVVSALVAPPPAAPVVAEPEPASAPIAVRPRPRGAKKPRPGMPPGVDVSVESGSLFVVISLPREEADARFSVQVRPSWATSFAIVGKKTTGFTISFGAPAPDHAHLEWRLAR